MDYWLSKHKQQLNFKIARLKSPEEISEWEKIRIETMNKTNPKYVLRNWMEQLFWQNKKIIAKSINYYKIHINYMTTIMKISNTLDNTPNQIAIYKSVVYHNKIEFNTYFTNMLIISYQVYHIYVQ